jgi:subtilisin-like proprotein convertase family protein
VIGDVFAVGLVVDALKLSPANPSLLDMRDAILLALDHKLAADQLTTPEHTSVRRKIWTVFARFGMGINAQSNGPFLSGIIASTTAPPVTTPAQVRIESTPNLNIPDRDLAGVTDTLEILEDGRVARMSVSVDIRHTFIGDLRVRVSSPGGKTAILHRGTGGSANDLIGSFSTDDTTSLADLIGEEVHGNWELNVADTVGEDFGTLRRWTLDVELA